MNKKIFVICTFLWACNGSGPSANDIDSAGGKQNAHVSNDTALIDNRKGESISSNVPDFLSLAKGAATTYQGFLQGVDRNDSSGPYLFREYFGDTLSFQIIFIPISGDKQHSNFDSLKVSEANNYANFKCFAFIYPMHDPDKSKDFHASNEKYPVEIRTFVKRGARWEFLSESKVNNLTEMSRYKIKCIFSVI
jgi:hypothetical protein